mmetsp:Transcript_27738/g.53988  ORF Transcript_27738/g.53988 Transcript_27738/m.53988 type:complete len:392 (-) Transcript_27738:511-1686(-)
MAELRQRKKAGSSTYGQPSKKNAGPSNIQGSPEMSPALLFLVIPVIILPGAACGYAYHTYGINFFIPESMQYLSHSAVEWQTEILPDKTVLYLGGPHRGGTTILWECLREHPDMADFGKTDTTGVDLSEGIFLQDVYPSFGIGAEVLQADWKLRRGGLGQYALLPEHRIHLNETYKRMNPMGQERLFNRFGYFWNLTKPVLLEKSPPNCVISRFLQAVTNLNVPGGLSVTLDPNNEDKPRFEGQSKASFVFINRHPFANAMSHQAWGSCKNMPFGLLIANWVQLNEYMHADIPFLQKVKVFKMEDFQQDPDPYLNEIYSFVGLDPTQVTRTVNVKKDTNSKYLTSYCQRLRSSKRAQAEHEAIKKQFADKIKQFGYEIGEWDCVGMATATE